MSAASAAAPQPTPVLDAVLDRRETNRGHVRIDADAARMLTDELRALYASEANGGGSSDDSDGPGVFQVRVEPLCPATDDAALRNAFAEFGEILEFRHDLRGDAHDSFATVAFASEASAQNALSAMDGYSAGALLQAPPQRAVTLSGVAPGTDTEALQAAFSKFGKIEALSAERVLFKRASSAGAAAQKLDGASIGGSTVSVAIEGADDEYTLRVSAVAEPELTVRTATDRWRVALRACAASGLSDEALELWSASGEMSGDAPTDADYDVVLRACRRGGSVENARAALELAISDDTRLAAVSAAFQICGEAGEWEPAQEILSEVLSGDHSPEYSRSVYRGALACAAKAAAADDALALLRDMGKDNATLPGLVEYNSVLQACANAGSWATANTLLDEIEADASLSVTEDDKATLDLAREVYAHSDDVMETSRLVFGNAPIVNYRTGRKVLRKKLIGRKLMAWYPTGDKGIAKMHKELGLDPYRTAEQERRALKLDKLKRRGKGPPKKGEGKRSGRR